MNSKNVEKECSSAAICDEADTPRKRLRLDNSGRRGWSLMDRSTDEEVLQEMGVSLLEPDAADVGADSEQCTLPKDKPNLKRNRDIENVNPNVNIIFSPRKGNVRSPKAKVSSPGPSKAKSPRSAEKESHSPLKQTDLETTITSEYLIDEETPLGQSISGQYVPKVSASVSCDDEKYGYTSTNTSVASQCACGADAFSALSDEVILSVFRWLPKRTLAHCMTVCKRWLRVACDETLWQRLDLGNKTLSNDALGRIIARKPVIVRLANSEIGRWHPTEPMQTSRIQYLDLSMSSIEQETLRHLLRRCTLLKKLSLESVLMDDETVALIGQCGNLEALNLTMAQGINATGLAAVLEGCTSIQSLNISWCNMNEEALNVLVTKLPEKLLRLNIGGARILTDDMVTTLVSRSPRLVELDISDCSRVTAQALASVRQLTHLEHLALSRCYLLPSHALTKLASMPSLQYLEVWGMLPASSLNTLRTTLPGIQINQFMFSAIARPTVGTRRTSIWGMRTRD